MPAAKTVAQRNYAASRPKARKRSVADARGKGIDTGSKAGAALVDPNKPLTDMQRSFVKLWASGETIMSAAMKAGYSDGGGFGYRMARMPNVLALYNEEKAAFERDNQMSRKKVMEGFMDGINMAMMLGEPSTIIAGWREVGKMCGYYAPVEIKQTVTHEGKILVDRLNQLSDVELMRLIEQRAEEIADADSNSTPALGSGT